MKLRSLFLLIFLCGCEVSNRQPDSTPTNIQQNFPERAVIPGIAAVDVHGNLTNKGFSLETIPGKEQPETQWQCKWRNPDSVTGQTFSANAFGVSPSKISSVNAFVSGGVDEAALEFLCYVATLKYDDANPTRATKWVQANIQKRSKNPTTKIGPCKLELAGNELSAVLMISPIDKGSSADTEAESVAVESKPTLDVPSTRTFSDASGKFSVEATVVKIDNEKITLKRVDNGKEVEIAISKLSEVDQAWIRDNH